MNRTDFSAPDARVDLVEFRVTADQSNLYFMARMTDIDQSEGDGAPQIQVAIDLDRSPGAGTEWLGGNSDTQVDPNAEWEYLAITRFGSNNPDVILWKDGWIGPVHTGIEAISTTTETIEFAVPWNDMEVQTFPRWVRFTVATFRANQSDDTWDIGGGTISNALDAVTNYGDPGITDNTWMEVSDGIVNYFFDVWFETDAEPFPPVLVVGVLPDPSFSEPANEFVRYFNATPFPLDISLYKIGDEEAIGAGEGMYQFPVGATMGPSATQILGNDSTAVADNYAITVDYDLADMTQYLTWATGNLYLSNSGDHVMILDGSDTVLDVAIWGSASYAGVAAIAQPASDTEIVRSPFTQDTNDCAVDFTTVYIPVELIGFTATATPDGVELQWETATEQDNLGFNIWRESDDALDCININSDIIPGAGTTLEPRSYSFMDSDVVAGMNYTFWLEQVDFNGATERFGPVSVSIPIALPPSLRVTVAPSPIFDGRGTVRLALPVSGRVHVSLFDIAGRELDTIWAGQSSAGSLTVDWDASDIVPGSYLVRVFSNAGSVTAPIVVR